jgi:hypothetical protein
MEEKRRLEKIIFADIDRAQQQYRADRTQRRDKMKSDYLKHPPKDAVLVFKEWKEAAAEKEEAQKMLVRLFGLDITTYPQLGLRVEEPSKIPGMESYDAETRKTESALTEMKRAYTLKLFAGGEEAQSLFASLADELKAIIAA